MKEESQVLERDAAALTREALQRAAALGGRDRLNCIAEIDPTAMAQALAAQAGQESGPLRGVPVLVKDNIDVAGLHTTAGSMALADHVAWEDAPIVRNLRRRGAVILGKTNMTEFANYTSEGMPNGYSSRGGQVIHALNPDLDPSGSSSGSAVAVAAGIVSVAVGTDTSFSILACAQANGVCGLKPPAGTLPWAGIVPIARTLDSAGPLARTFQEAVDLYDAMREEPLPSLRPAPVQGLKIAVNTVNVQQVSQGQRDFLRRVLELLRRQGAQVEEIRQPPSPQMRTIMRWEFKPHLEDYLRRSRASLRTLEEIVADYRAHPQTMMRYGITYLQEALEASQNPEERAAYQAAMEDRAQAIPQISRELAGFDAAIMTGPTNVMHFCGLPGAAVASDVPGAHGVPRGLILYGGEETRLYQAALTLEQCMRQGGAA